MSKFNTIAPEQIQNLIFQAGFSTKTEVTEISGRGVGLDVVKDAIERLQGQIKVESQVGNGCTFRLILRANRSILPILALKEKEHFYGVPIEQVVMVLRLTPAEIITLEQRPHIIWQGQTIPIPLYFLTDLLRQSPMYSLDIYTCLILELDSKYGLMVEQVLDYQKVQLKPTLKLANQLLGATILGDGNICYILNLASLLNTSYQLPDSNFSRVEKLPLQILLVEDSIPIRTQLRRILMQAGYAVTTASNGLEGLHKYQDQVFDIVVSDVEMPNLNGLELTQRIRTLNAKIPIVLVTTLAKPEDQARGLETGANAYITKGNFTQDYYWILLGG